MENNEKETFQYTYSAKEQKEIQNIRKKYAAPEENKMERLRKLDASVTQKATTVALIPGIIGALLLGFGMSLAMSDLSAKLGFSQNGAMIIGIIIGIIGIALVCCAYPLYNHVIKKERAKIAPEILRLTEELMK
jgi:uncharacterized membrane protein YuzA (DUF378 family)